MERSKRVTQRAQETWRWRWDEQGTLEPQCDQSRKQRTVQQTRTTLTTKKRHYKQTSSAVVQSTALTSLQLVFSWVSTCFRFAATLNILLCLSLCIRVYNQFTCCQCSHIFTITCTWIPCRFCRFSHCENGSFEVLSLHKEKRVPYQFDSTYHHL